VDGNGAGTPHGSAREGDSTGDHCSPALRALLAARRSTKAYSSTPPTLTQMGAVLGAAAGTREDERRAHPSAHARYPVEVYLVTGALDGR